MVNHGFMTMAAEGTFFDSNLRSERPQKQKLKNLLKVTYHLKTQTPLQLDPIGLSKTLLSLVSLGRNRLRLLQHCSAALWTSTEKLLGPSRKTPITLLRFPVQMTHFIPLQYMSNVLLFCYTVPAYFDTDNPHVLIPLPGQASTVSQVWLLTPCPTQDLGKELEFPVISK